jgi:hypothetical protein
LYLSVGSETIVTVQLRDNAPELLESEYAHNMDPTLMMYLSNYNSVPAFLAATTLQLFENQTQM